MTFIAQLILGAIWAVTLLAVLDPLGAWRRDEPRKRDEQWRNDMFGGRMRARPFIAVAAAVAVVTILIAQGMGGVLSSVGGFIAFVVGASIGGAARHTQLRLVYRTVLGAVNEIRGSQTRNRQGAEAKAAGNASMASRRRRIDKEIARDEKKKVVRAATPDTVATTAIDVRQPRPVVIVTVPRRPAPTATRRPDERALLKAQRRNLVVQLKARSAALASAVARQAVPVAPAVPLMSRAMEPPPSAAGSALAAQASSELQSARARHRLWQVEAAAQRQAWRQAGETQRRQWREEAAVLRKIWQRPGDTAAKDSVQHPE